MLITNLIRISDDGRETLGVLIAFKEGQLFFCRTLELSYRSNQRMVSSIPKGEYICRYTYSHTFKKYTYEVTSVKDRSGIRIHPANFVSSLEGCIALGDDLSDINNDGLLDVKNSRATVLRFEEFMNREPFKLIIK
jgi:hypothetical protein